MSDAQHAANDMLRAVEKMFIVVQLQADILGMEAENKIRESQDKAIAHDEEAFVNIKDSYYNQFYRT